MARALVDRESLGCTALLTGGGNPALRFGVHGRHYTTRLTRALVERFAATVWLADAFPTYVGLRESAAALPYLTQSATMDWHLGRLAIAVDSKPLTLIF